MHYANELREVKNELNMLLNKDSKPGIKLINYANNADDDVALFVQKHVQFILYLA